MVKGLLDSLREPGLRTAALPPSTRFGTISASLYILVLSRFPSPEERAAGLAALSGGNRTEAAEDLMWSFYNKIGWVFT